MTTAALPAETVSALGITPSPITFPASFDPEVIAAFEESLQESAAEVGPMPAVLGMFTGVLAGAVPADFVEGEGENPPGANVAGTAVVRLVMGSEADAEQAITVVEQRWNSLNSLRIQEPFTSLMEIISTSVAGNVAQIDFHQIKSPGVWQQLVFNRDLAPFQAGPD